MSVPVIGHDNPFYRPGSPGTTFMDAFFNRNIPRRGAPLSKVSISRADSSGDSSFEHEIDSDWNLDQYFTSGNTWFQSPNIGQHDLPPYSSSESPLPRQTQGLAKGGRGISYFRQNKRRPKRKSAETFSDFDAPPRYARSIHSVHESSFDLEVRRDRLQLEGIPSSPHPLDALRSSGNQNVCSIGVLIDLLDTALPGVRLRQRLRDLNPPNVDTIADFLAANDNLNKRVLEILGTSAITKLNLHSKDTGPKMGLNLRTDDVYSALSKPEAFQQLTEISFANTSIRAFDLIHLHHLPRLISLNLNQSGIGNEGVYLLIPLKRTLTRLSLATNVDIDNNAIYALLLLKNLAFLSIYDTAIDMIGVRQIAHSLDQDNRKMTLKIPFVCQEYLDTIETKYFVNAAPPLITKEHLCPQLSSATLKRNLEAHAACNPAIVTSGTRAELVFRLSEIVRTRNLDKLVLAMMEVQDADKENNPRG